MLVAVYNPAFISTLASHSLKISSKRIIGDGEKPLEISTETGDTRKGQYFICIPEFLSSILPGSEVDPENIRDHLFLPNEQSARLISDRLPNNNKPVLSYQDPLFSLSVYHGSLNPHALKLSELATNSFHSAGLRAAYQREVREVMQPLFATKTRQGLHIIEDCIATSDSIMGVLSLFLMILPHLLERNVRIAVAVATTQGICILQKFAQDNDIHIDLHCGYCAYGLSAGEKVPGSDIAQRANYIIYPETVVAKLPRSIKTMLNGWRQPDGNVYVVGDMGDGGKALPDDMNIIHVWNKYRLDKQTMQHGQSVLEKQSPLTLFFATGGYFMHALAHEYSHNVGAEHILSAKRIWSKQKQHGYGVLISHI